MRKPYPREFRDDVVRVARDRDAGVTVEQIAKDFGVHPMTLFKWLRQADVDAGARPGTTAFAVQITYDKVAHQVTYRVTVSGQLLPHAAQLVSTGIRRTRTRGARRQARVASDTAGDGHGTGVHSSVTCPAGGTHLNRLVCSAGFGGGRGFGRIPAEVWPGG